LSSPTPPPTPPRRSHPSPSTTLFRSNNSRGDRTANTLLTISPTAGSSCEDVTHTCTSTVASDHTVTGTDAGAATTTDTATLHVTHAEAQRVALSGLTTDLTSGATRLLTATIQDAFGNTVTDGTGSTATVAFAKTAGTGTVSGLNGSATAAGGVATDTVTGVLVGPITIHATSGTLADGAGNPISFTIVHGGPAKVALSGL